MGLLSGADMASFACCCDDPANALTVWCALACPLAIIGWPANLHTTASYNGLVKSKPYNLWEWT